MYADTTNLEKETYRGDVVTAYVIGAMEQQQIDKPELDRLTQLSELQKQLIELYKEKIELKDNTLGNYRSSIDELTS